MDFHQGRQFLDGLVKKIKKYGSKKFFIETLRSQKLRRRNFHLHLIKNWQSHVQINKKKIEIAADFFKEEDYV